MSNNNKNTYTFSLLVLFFFSQNCFANPIIIDPASTISKIGLAILINCLVDFIVIAIGFVLIKRFYYVLSFDFLKYLLYVVIIGFVVDAVVVILLKNIGINSHRSSIPSISCAFILLFISNVILSRFFWDLSYKESFVIGTMMGLITNPYIIIMLFGNF